MDGNNGQILVSLFSSHTRVKVLTLFLSNQNRAFYVREISRKVGERINSVRRELENLMRTGLLTNFPEKNKLYYKVNTDFIIFKELKAIIQKTTDVKDDMGEKFREVGNFFFVVLSGVFTGYKESPTDVLIVGEDFDKKALERVIKELEEEVGDALRYTVLNTNDYILRDSLGDRFLMSITKSESIIVIDERHKISRSIKK